MARRSKISSEPAEWTARALFSGRSALAPSVAGLLLVQFTALFIRAHLLLRQRSSARLAVCGTIVHFGSGGSARLVQ